MASETAHYKNYCPEPEFVNFSGFDPLKVYKSGSGERKIGVKINICCSTYKRRHWL
jgi:hypothetical protein